MKNKTPTYSPRFAVIFLFLLFSSALVLHEWHTLYFHDSEITYDGCNASNSKTTHWHDENTHHHCDWSCGTLPTTFENISFYVLSSSEKLIQRQSAFAFISRFSSSTFTFSKGRAPPVF